MKTQNSPFVIYPPRTSDEMIALAIHFRDTTTPTINMDDLKRASGWSQDRTAMHRYAVQAVQLRKLGR